uniref:Uncharacterized protein n=2 Tax=Oryza sativa subsp. japonica TaxID=39947 RepID=Q10EX8_ORYSJ|nr:hypothetical protein [Oryza sativa Japonica Group]ABF98287.1 expressed protein [Oryza sativa Japonica Group]
MAPSPLAPSMVVEKKTATQHDLGVRFSGTISRRCDAVSAVGGANSGNGWSKARRRACGSSRERDGWAWHSCVAMAQIAPGPHVDMSTAVASPHSTCQRRSSSIGTRIDVSCDDRNSEVLVWTEAIASAWKHLREAGYDWTGRKVSFSFSLLFISGRGLLGASNPFLLSWAYSARTQAREQQRLNRRDRLELLVSPAIWGIECSLPG